MNPISPRTTFPEVLASQEPLVKLHDKLSGSIELAEAKAAVVESGAESGDYALVRPWISLAFMGLNISANDYSSALVYAEDVLRNLVDLNGDDEDVDYLALVAGVIYNLALTHHLLGENSRAEKELVKAQKLLSKLARKDHNRFGATVVMAIEASTTIFNSRLRQMNVLAHYQLSTDLYLDKANHGVKQAVADLVSSLQQQGDLHLSMGNYRDAVKFYTKALRYQKRITAKMGMVELRISINMGRALLQIVNRKSTGEQLLNSLIPLAERLDAQSELNEIRSILEHNEQAFDFITYVKKLFKKQ